MHALAIASVDRSTWERRCASMVSCFRTCWILRGGFGPTIWSYHEEGLEGEEGLDIIVGGARRRAAEGEERWKEEERRGAVRKVKSVKRNIVRG